MARELSTLQTVARVRGVFARHWIDLGLIIIMYSNGTVRLQGKLQKLQHAGERVDEVLLNAIDQEIRRVRGVRRVNFNFENWIKTSSGWERIRDRKEMVRSVAGSAGAVHDDSEDEEKPEEEEAPPEEGDRIG